MPGNKLLELESLFSGKKETIEIIVESTSVFRDEILSKLNDLLTDKLPGCRFEGEFIDTDSCDYMIYELHVTGMMQNNTFSSIKMFDFGDKVRLVRI